MSTAHEPMPEGIETVITPHSRDLGAFSVRRALPAAGRQMVGPFIFFDHFGPASLSTGTDLGVRPHPHIGLATVSYLLEGAIDHRDSLGTHQIITPGAVNWMIAGRGITHSERSPAELMGAPQPLHGLQTWVALPAVFEETAPGFEHVPASALPSLDDTGLSLRVVLGAAYGARAPVRTFSELFYVDARLSAWTRLKLPSEHEDRAAYVLNGEVEVSGEVIGAGQMLVFTPGQEWVLRSGAQGARLMLLGGERLGPRYISWNFVSSRRERIEEAKAAWRAADWQRGPFTLPPGDDKEHIPLP